MTTPDRDETKYQYIETPEEKRAHAPKRATDEVLAPYGEWIEPQHRDGVFEHGLIYRRALPVPAGKANEPYPSPMQETLERLAVIAMSARDLLQAGGDKERSVAAALQIVILESANFHTAGPAGKLPVPAEAGWTYFSERNPSDSEFPIEFRHKTTPVGSKSGVMSDIKSTVAHIGATMYVGWKWRSLEKAPQPAQEPDADAEGWIDASKRQPELGKTLFFWWTFFASDKWSEPVLCYNAKFAMSFEGGAYKWRPAHVTIPPAPRAETQDEIDRKIAEELWLKIPGDVGARKTDYITGVLDGLKAERERAKP